MQLFRFFIRRRASRGREFLLDRTQSSCRLSALTIGAHLPMSEFDHPGELLRRAAEGIAGEPVERGFHLRALQRGVDGAVELADHLRWGAGQHQPPSTRWSEKSGKPLSIMVGASGSSGLRWVLVTASARSWPALISGSRTEMPSKVNGMWPPTTSWIEGPPPDTARGSR